MASAARDRAVAPQTRGNPVYLHQLYREAEPQPQPQPFVRRELMFFCSSLKWCILIFLGFASFFVLLWMISHPSFPQLNIVSAAMSAVSVSATAGAECNISFLLTNPNCHHNTVSDGMEISLIYASQQVLLSQFHQPLFVQPKRSQLTFRTNLSFSCANLGSAVITAMKHDLDRGSLGFMIRISAFLKYGTGKWKITSRFMRAYRVYFD